MQAIVLRAFGSPDNLRPETVADPAPGSGEVLMRVHACGVCHHDVINRRGNLPRTSVPAAYHSRDHSHSRQAARSVRRRTESAVSNVLTAVVSQLVSLRSHFVILNDDNQ